MNTIQRSFSVLRNIALAGIGATTLWAAAPAYASIDASNAAGLEATRAARGQAVSRYLAPLGEARLAVPAQSLVEPILVAPDCPHCFWRQDLARPLGGEQASEPKALPAPVLMAPNCGGGCYLRTDPAATHQMTEPLLVAPTGCGNNCGRFGQLAPTATQQLAEPQALPAPILVAPTGCNAGCRPAATPVDIRMAPAPLLLAGGEPPVVVDSWWRRLFG